MGPREKLKVVIKERLLEKITIDLVYYLAQRSESKAFDVNACKQEVIKSLIYDFSWKDKIDVNEIAISDMLTVMMDVQLDTAMLPILEKIKCGIDITPTSEWLWIASSINVETKKIYIKIKCDFSKNQGAENASNFYIQKIYDYFSWIFWRFTGASYDGWLDDVEGVPRVKLQDIEYGITKLDCKVTRETKM